MVTSPILERVVLNARVVVFVEMNRMRMRTIVVVDELGRASDHPV